MLSADTGNIPVFYADCMRKSEMVPMDPVVTFQKHDQIHHIAQKRYLKKSLNGCMMLSSYDAMTASPPSLPPSVHCCPDLNACSLSFADVVCVCKSGFAGQPIQHELSL